MSKKFTSYTNQQFAKSLIGDDLLDRAIEYVRDYLKPDEVYDESELEEWAKDSGFVKPE